MACLFVSFLSLLTSSFFFQWDPAATEKSAAAEKIIENMTAKAMGLVMAVQAGGATVVLTDSDQHFEFMEDVDEATQGVENCNHQMEQLLDENSENEFHSLLHQSHWSLLVEKEGALFSRLRKRLIGNFCALQCQMTLHTARPGTTSAVQRLFWMDDPKSQVRSVF